MYVAETRAETNKIRRIENTSEMETLRIIQGKTLRD